MTRRVLFPTQEAAEIEARRLRSEQKRDLFDFVASPSYDWTTTPPTIEGYYVGMVSCDG